MRNFLVVVSLMTAFGLDGTAQAATHVADVIYTNGKIYTVNEKALWADAVAIRDGEFIAVGSNDEIERLKGPGTRSVDLGGGFVMPGLHDTHLHFESFYTSEMLEGQMLTLPPEEDSIKALQKILKDYADKNPTLEILFAEGLRSELFPNVSPTKAFIDDVVPGRPFVILTASEHETLHNTKALKMAGITANSSVPEGGEIVLDTDTGEPTGFLKETAAGKWGWVHYPQLTREQHRQGMKALIAYLNSIGITSGKQQHAKNPVATAFQDLEKDGELSMRIALSWTYKGPLEPMPLADQEKMIEERKQFASDLIDTEFVKLSMDGTAGTTGLVIEPYVGGNHGVAFYSLEELGKDAARFDAMGLGITAHASGDGAVRLFLDGLEAAQKINGDLKARHQIAHAHFIHADDLARIKELNSTVEFSPAMWFQTALTDGLGEFLGPERMAHALPARSVLNNGGRVVFASDGPLFWQEPLHSIESTVTRRTPVGEGGVLAPDEAVDLADAIRAYTIDSAYLMNQDEKVGTIEAGKRADMIVLERNLFDISPQEISEAKVQLTIFDGEVVYDASKNPRGEQAIEEHYDVELDLTGEDGHPGCEIHEEHLSRIGGS